MDSPYTNKRVCEPGKVRPFIRPSKSVEASSEMNRTLTEVKSRRHVSASLRAQRENLKHGIEVLGPP